MWRMQRVVAMIAVGFSLFFLSSVRAVATTIASVIPRPMEAQRFQRIGEFFHGKEVQGRRFIIRTSVGQGAWYIFQ